MGLFKKPEVAEAEEPLNIQPRKAATNFTLRPWPVPYGTHTRAGIYLDGITGGRTEAIKERVKTGKSSSEEVTRAINYFGTVPVGIGYGPLYRLIAILKDDEPVWEGDLRVTNEPFFTINIEGESSPMILYTGLQDEGTMRGGGMTDPAMKSGHPPYRGKIFYVFEDLLFGTSPTPPNFQLVFEVVHRSLVLDPANTTGHPENDDIDLHRIDQGQLIPEVIYSAMTDPLFGGSLEADDFDLPSWVAACNTLRSEGLGYSPELDQKTSIDRFVKDLLNICQGEIIDVNGKLTFKLLRTSDPAVTLPEEAFLKDPVVTPGSWRDGSIVNEARIPYYLVSRNLEPLPTLAKDDASREQAGVRSKNYQFKGFRSELAAHAMANRLVKALGFPSVKYDISLSSAYRNIRKGDVVAPVYPSFGLDGSTRLRVTDRSLADPGRGGVTLKAEVDKTYLASAETGQADEEVIFTNPDPEEISGHILALPASQKENFADGAIIPMSRASGGDDRAVVSMGWNGTDFEAVRATGAFPLRVNIESWRDFGDGEFTIDFRFEHAHEETQFLESITDTLPDWHLLTAKQGGAGLEIKASWSIIKVGSALQPMGGGLFTVTFLSDQFATGFFAFDGEGPSAVAYLGPVSGFMFYRTNQRAIERDEGNAPLDTDKIRRIAIQSSRRGRQQDFANAYRLDYDRATDTLTPSWGGVVTHAFSYGISVTGATGTAPHLVTIEVSGSENFDYSAEWGDGSTTETGSGVNGDQITHTFTTAGTYNIVLTLTPSSGGAPRDFPVTVVVT